MTCETLSMTGLTTFVMYSMQEFEKYKRLNHRPKICNILTKDLWQNAGYICGGFSFPDLVL